SSCAAFTTSWTCASPFPGRCLFPLPLPPACPFTMTVLQSRLSADAPLASGGLYHRHARPGSNTCLQIRKPQLTRSLKLNLRLRFRDFFSRHGDSRRGIYGNFLNGLDDTTEER